MDGDGWWILPSKDKRTTKAQVQMAEKKEYMFTSLRTSNQERVGPKINIGHYDFEVANNFIYLGTEFTSDNIRGRKKNHTRQQMYIGLEQTNAFKTHISKNQGQALPPANYASLILWKWEMGSQI
uniref:Uncharacterized protein n=1 Tax=Megaselia scalaris TaxID=36166 RepID=T1GJW6_MEGSC